MALRHFVPLWHRVKNTHKYSKTCWGCPTFHSHLTIHTIAAVSFGIDLDFKEDMAALTKAADRKDKGKVPSLICLI